MDKQPSTAKRLEWEENIRRQRESGLSILRWCRDNEIISHRFYYWKERLCPTSAMSRTHFSELHDESNDEGIAITCSGIRIELEKNFDQKMLARCLRLLKGA